MSGLDFDQRQASCDGLLFTSMELIQFGVCQFQFNLMCSVVADSRSQLKPHQATGTDCISVPEAQLYCETRALLARVRMYIDLPRVFVHINARQRICFSDDEHEVLHDQCT